jgi:hypothetical protein
METNISQSGGVLQKLAAMPKKKPGAVLSLETVLYVAIIIIFVAIGLGIFSQRESAKVAACNQELDQIRSAVVQYGALDVNGTNGLTDLTKLFDASAISATDAVDGVAHGYFLQKSGRWKDGKLHNPWGDGEYTLGTDPSGGTGKAVVTTHNGNTYSILIGELGD